MQDLNQTQWAVVGNWHLAYVTSACLTKLGKKVALVNMVEAGFDVLPEPPVYEPGLPEILRTATVNGSLQYIEGISDAWAAKYVWLAIDTPVNAQDEVDVAPLEEAIALLAKNHNSQSQVLVLSSQVPLGFCEQVESQYGFQVVYIPENLRLGKGIETFLKADRTVIGATRPELREEIRQVLSGLETDFLLCDLQTAEMIKHATNAFLATSISFSNELARIGERFGVDNQVVGKALRMDKRIGRDAYVLPGLGFAGGTLPRDLRVLQKLGEKAKVSTPLVDAVLKVNETTTQAVSDTVTNFCGGSLLGKTILILGYTYKAETNTLRRSFSVELAELFSRQGATVLGFDPFMNGADLSAFNETLKHYAEWETIPQCPDVAVIMTNREAFTSLDWSVLKSKAQGMQPLVVDVRGMLSKERVLPHGFSYKALWQPVTRA